jgi:hypothetical protein
VDQDVDAEIDRLYGLPLEQFVAARNELARTLRQSGGGEAAADVSALRKPTLVAWAVNQLAHTRRREIDLLLDAGKRLIDAQQALIAGGQRAEIEGAQTSLRNAVRGLTDAAAEILGKRASTATLAKVAETLRSAATAAEGRELLARGRLVEELSETGWDIVATLTPAPAAERRVRERQRQRRAAEKDTEKDAAEERTRREAELRELGRARAAAAKRLDAARLKERAARDRLDEAKAARTAAEDELGGLEREIERLERRSGGR